MNLITINLDDYKPHPQNPNGHPDKQLTELGESLDQFGQFKNVVVWNGYYLAGHGLVEAARRKGLATLAAVDMSHLSEDKALTLMVADNRLPEMAVMDDAALTEILKIFDEPLDIPGIDEDFLKSLGIGRENEKETEAQIDKAEQLQEKWQVNEGDIWQIGDHHRLICGDCREIETVKAVCGGEKVNGIFTSPPYAEQRKAQYGGVPVAEYVDWWKAVQSNARAVLAEDGSFFVNIKPHSEDKQRTLYVFDLVCQMVRKWEWFFIDELCWIRKAVPGYWPNRFKNAFEPIYHFALSDKPKFNPKNVIRPFARKEYVDAPTYDEAGNMSFGNGSTRRSKNFDGALPDNVLRIETGITQKDSGAYHQAYFPPQLPTFFIKAYSDPGNLWLDPFAGSGTTGIAAHNEGRRSAMVEKLPKYCSVILERFQQHCDIEPVLTNF